jgi:signal transduction histidine kinase
MTDPSPLRRKGDPRLRIPRLATVVAVAVVSVALGVNLVMAVLSWRSLGAWAGFVLASAGLVFVFRNPRVAVLVTALAPVVVGLLGWMPTLTWSVVCFIGFLITVRGLSALVVGPALGVANLVGVWLVTGTINPSVNSEASIAAFSAVLLVAVGSAVRNNDGYRAELERRAQDAIASRDEAIRLGVAEERVRIARDLHDGVGHQVAVLSMHLGTAETKLTTDLDMTRRALNEARTDVQTLLKETHSILRILKADNEPDLIGPTADHHNIAAMVAGFRDAGLELEANLPNLNEIALDPTGSTAAYRIVQEGLTNASRYGTGQVSLHIEPRPGWLHIEMINTRRTDQLRGRTSGQGLLGMHARADAAGGRLEAEPQGRLFRVSADLPILGVDQ